MPQFQVSGLGPKDFTSGLWSTSKPCFVTDPPRHLAMLCEAPMEAVSCPSDRHETLNTRSKLGFATSEP